MEENNPQDPEDSFEAKKQALDTEFSRIAKEFMENTVTKPSPPDPSKAKELLKAAAKQHADYVKALEALHKEYNKPMPESLVSNLRRLTFTNNLTLRNLH